MWPLGGWGGSRGGDFTVTPSNGRSTIYHHRFANCRCLFSGARSLIGACEIKSRLNDIPDHSFVKGVVCCWPSDVSLRLVPNRQSGTGTVRLLPNGRHGRICLTVCVYGAGDDFGFGRRNSLPALVRSSDVLHGMDRCSKRSLFEGIQNHYSLF